MISPLRAWHRRWWLLLAIALPLLVLLAIASRQPVPAVDELPTVGSSGEISP